MHTILNLAQHGLSTPDIALTSVRVLTGTFFAASGWNKLTNAGRHSTILQTMIQDKVPFPRVMQWWVPGNEFVMGTLLFLGLFSAFSATVLAIICIVACSCEARSRVAAYKPINTVDTIDDWLYLPEVLYIAMLSIPVFVGHGALAIDNLF